MLSVLAGFLLSLSIISPVQADFPPTSCVPSFEQYKRIELGMSYQQIVEIIGCEGVLVSQHISLTRTSAEYSWDFRKSFLQYLHLDFVNEQLTSKLEVGLLNSPTQKGK